MTTRTEPSLAALRRLRVISLVVLGAFIPLMLDAVLRVFTLHRTPGSGGSWQQAASSIGMLAGCAATMVIAYRVVRYSKLPGTAAILLLMAVVVATAILSHFS
jgi:hypothetical protein